MRFQSYMPAERNNLLNIILIWFITLCSVKFYDFVSITMGKAVVLLSLLIVISFLVVNIIYNPGLKAKRHFSIEIYLIFSSLIISSIAAIFFHDQPLLITLYSQFSFYLIFFYFLLGKLNIKQEQIINMILWLGYIYSIIYFVQWLLYPSQIVTSRMIVDRGSLRIMLPGAEFMVVSWLILINRYLLTRKIKNIFGLLPFIVIMILLATRQVLAATALVTIIFVLTSRQHKSKLTIIFLVMLATIPFYFMFKGIFDEMINISQEQHGSIEQNIRLLAAKYFLFDFNDNPIWILTGNGHPAPHTSYETFLSRVSDELGYYQSDIGLIGDLSKFGILYFIGVLIAVIKLMVTKHNEDFLFIRFTALTQLLTFFTGSGLRSSTIVLLCLLFYMTDKEELLQKTDREKLQQKKDHKKLLHSSEINKSVIPNIIN